MLDKIILKELKLKAEKEYRFHPKRKWKMDYAIPSIMVGVEVEGGLWKEGGGRHNRWLHSRHGEIQHGHRYGMENIQDHSWRLWKGTEVYRGTN